MHANRVMLAAPRENLDETGRNGEGGTHIGHRIRRLNAVILEETTFGHRDFECQPECSRGLCVVTPQRFHPPVQRVGDVGPYLALAATSVIVFVRVGAERHGKLRVLTSWTSKRIAGCALQQKLGRMALFQFGSPTFRRSP